MVTDEHGQVIEQYAFTQLVIGGNLDRRWIADSEANLTQSELTPLPKAKAVTNASLWQVDAMPAGFKRILEMNRHLRSKKSPVMHLVFSDGMAGVSIFIEDVASAANLNTGLNSNGSVQVYNKVAGNKLITVVGEVPPRTVIQIAESVRFAGQ